MAEQIPKERLDYMVGRVIQSVVLADLSTQKHRTVEEWANMPERFANNAVAIAVAAIRRIDAEAIRNGGE